MITLIAILALIASALLIGIVLIQKPKGGGISNNFAGGANQIFGVKRTSDIVEKSTWYLSGIIAVLLLVASGYNTKVSETNDVDLTPTEEVQKALDNPGTSTQAPQGNPNSMQINPDDFQDAPEN